MTTDSGKKPRECWGVFCEHGVHYYTTKEEAFNNSDVCITARVKFVQPTPCANCERLEETLTKESTFLGVANNGWQFEEQRNKQLQSVIERLQKQLEMCKEALEFYASATHMCLKDKDKEQLASGHYLQVGRKARECLAKLEKE